MDNLIQLHHIRRNGSKIVYDYTATGEISHYLKESESFWIEYEHPVSDVPDSVLALPFVGNMMALGMLFNAEIRVPVIDHDFATAIPQILEGYRSMYAGRGPINVRLSTDKTERAVPPPRTNAKLLFFSGGTDCTYTLTKHLQNGESIALLQIHGADIPHTNTEAWNSAVAFTQKIAKEHRLILHTIKSNLHTFVYEGILDAFIQEHFSENFWHGFQHSLGMLTLSAPIVWHAGYREICFASTFSLEEAVYQYTCASTPSIDNLVRFCGCQVVHDGAEASRQNKLHAIVAYSRMTGNPLPMRVCYLSTKGINCCQCEKCIRTALGIYAENEDPNAYGFPYTEETLSDAVNTYAFTGKEMYYKSIQIVLKKNRTYEEMPAGLRGFYTLPFEEWWAASKCAKLLRQQYLELKTWTDNLQSSKDWLEAQYHSQNTTIEELQTQCMNQQEVIHQLQSHQKSDSLFKRLFK